MSLYPVASRAAAGFTEGGQVPGGGLMVALRLEDVCRRCGTAGR